MGYGSENKGTDHNKRGLGRNHTAKRQAGCSTDSAAADRRRLSARRTPRHGQDPRGYHRSPVPARSLGGREGVKTLILQSKDAYQHIHQPKPGIGYGSSNQQISANKVKEGLDLAAREGFKIPTALLTIIGKPTFQL